MRRLIALLLGSLVVAGCDRQSGTAPQANAITMAATTRAPELTGRLDIAERGTVAPKDSFFDPAGKPITLAAFKGRPVLVNLWATWCGPCIREMPTLDHIADRAGGKLKVVTVSQDRVGVDLAATFAKGGFKHLERYRDPENKLGFAFNTGMLPTTVLYDASGKEVWRIVGAMNWNGPRANTLLVEFIG